MLLYTKQTTFIDFVVKTYTKHTEAHAVLAVESFRRNGQSRDWECQRFSTSAYKHIVVADRMAYVRASHNGSASLSNNSGVYDTSQQPHIHMAICWSRARSIGFGMTSGIVYHTKSYQRHKIQNSWWTLLDMLNLVFVVFVKSRNRLVWIG